MPPDSTYSRSCSTVDSDTAHVFQACLLSHVTVEEQPKLAMLRRSDEDWVKFAKVP